MSIALRKIVNDTVVLPIVRDRKLSDRFGVDASVIINVSVTGPASGHYFPNGDINWNNVASDALTEVNTYYNLNNIDSYYIGFKKIDATGLTHAIKMTGCSSIVIDNCDIIGADSHQVYFVNSASGITLRNCRQRFTASDVNAVTFLSTKEMSNILIEGNWWEEVNIGCRLQDIDGCSNVIVRGNFCKNPRFGHTHIYYSSSCSGVQIHQNVGWAHPDSSDVEDWINTYRSSGVSSTDCIMITENLLAGSGRSVSGGGIMAADVGKSETLAITRYIQAQSNQLLDPGQYGIAITQGRCIRLLDNKVLANSDSLVVNSQNVGCYVWRIDSSHPGTMYDCEVSRNSVYWAHNTLGTQHSWFPSTGNDGETPNHGTSANSPPYGWLGTNSFGYPWTRADFDISSEWEYFPPS